MEIHFYENFSSFTSNDRICHFWKATENCIRNNEPFINTTQMGLLSTDLFSKDYRIFVHTNKDKFYEIKLGHNDCTTRQIKMSHNLFKLWQAGEFSCGEKPPLSPLDEAIRALDRLKLTNPNQKINVEAIDNSFSIKIGDALIFDGCDGSLNIDAE